MAKTYAEINDKIKKGTAVVLTAEEVAELAKTLSPKEIAEKSICINRGIGDVLTYIKVLAPQ